MNQASKPIHIQRSRGLLRWLISSIGRLFYPQVAQIGQLPAGPLILAANHPNGLLDGLVLLLAIQRPMAFLAKSTFYANVFLRLALHGVGAVPVYRPADIGKPGGPSAGHADANSASFSAARSLLIEGGMLAIFPEGTPSPTLLPLKTGLARIGLGAEAQAGWALGLRIVPVGLWFERQTRPGTAALVLLGQPVVVAEFQDAYQRNQEDAVRALTVQVQHGLAGAVAAAQQAGERSRQQARVESRVARASMRGVGWAQQGAWVALLALGAPPAVVGHILALPGRVIAWLILQLLARRHRATVGTIQLVALVAGLLLGWAVVGVSVGLRFGLAWGMLALIAGPLCGYIGLCWQQLIADS